MRTALAVLALGLALTACAIDRPSELSLRNCGVSGEIVPDVQSGLRQPPEEIVGHMRCRF